MTEIEQVMARIATLTDEEIATLNDTPLPMPEIIEADNKVGSEVSLVMSQVPDDADPGVYAIARVAVLGILAGDEVLKRVWTDVVGPFEADTTETPADPWLQSETVVEAPHVPTPSEVEELAPAGDTGEALPPVETPEVTEEPAPVTSEPEEVAPALEEVPLDIPEGEITVE